MNERTNERINKFYLELLLVLALIGFIEEREFCLVIGFIVVLLAENESSKLNGVDMLYGDVIL